MMLGPTLETDRLILRPPGPEDWEPFAAFCADPETMRHLGGPQVRPVAWRTFAGFAGSWVVRGFGMFSVIERAGGRWIGRVGPLYPEGWPGTEVGWGLTRAASGRGYATEAAAAAIDWAFDRLGWRAVIHCIDAENHASVAVARRLGSVKTGAATLPPPVDRAVDLWGQTREAWRGRPN